MPKNAPIQLKFIKLKKGKIIILANMKERIIAIIERFKDKKVLVIGDLMLDKFIWGNVDRISPEAPVPVVLVKKVSYAPGGAANAASNITSLGGKASVAGVIGDGQYGRILASELEKRGIATENIIVDPSRPTIRKTRVMAQNQQLLRIDSEIKDKVSEAITNSLLRAIRKVIDDSDCIVVSDYAKGLITEESMRAIILLASEKKKKVIVDPKQKNGVIYRGAYVMTPNHKEACAMLDFENNNHDTDIGKIGKMLSEKLSTNVVLTRGEKGMSIFEKGKEMENIPTKVRSVYDVAGAGDTVIAALALSVAAGATIKEAAIIANYAAGVAVGKVGTSTVSPEELVKAIKQDNGA